MRLPRIPYWYLLLPPWVFIAVGTVMNTLAVVSNHGQMPVLWPGGCGAFTMADDITHTCMTSLTHLRFLSDWIVIPDYGVASLGDLLIWGYERMVFPCLFIWIAFVVKDYDERSR